ncbi:ATP-grasp fold amidoligase family protein [Planctomycetota bacterium]
MKKWLLQFYRQNAFGKTLLSIPRSVYLVATNHLLSDEAWCRNMFAWSHGYAFDLDNPRTLNEKIQWLKLHNRCPDFTNWADKYKVRDYIADALGDRYLIPLLAAADDPYQINFDTLPRPFIVKPSHSSGPMLMVPDKTTIDWDKELKQLRKWLKTNLYDNGREWHYKNIPPKILVERLLLDEEGNVPFDYKFHCFHGHIVAIQVDIDRQTNHRRNFYDVNWSRLPFTWSVCVGNRPIWPQGRDIAKPTVLPELIELTERLAKAFVYVRIDWYVVENKIYFGEVTFHHGGGCERILPFEWDLRLGGKLQLPLVRE